MPWPLSASQSGRPGEQHAHTMTYALLSQTDSYSGETLSYLNTEATAGGIPEVDGQEIRGRDPRFPAVFFLLWSRLETPFLFLAAEVMQTAGSGHVP